MTTRTTTVRVQQMARHALSCRSCKGNVALIQNGASHLEKQEAMATIEWCAFRRENRRAHA